jgi:haloacetate dehalogenase
MFEGFDLREVETAGAVLRVRDAGEGPAVLLLHGHPRTHTTWHRVAPLLVEAGYRVVCPDLRGYGKSSKPESDATHAAYSKRSMAQDCVELMAALGIRRFRTVGHDRGAYVAFRLAMEHPAVVEALTVMDAVPIVEALERCDARFAAAWWHWFFLGQTAKPAEPLIDADPDGWYRADADAMGRENYEDHREAIHDPATVHAMCEDYRAGLTIDRRHDEEDRSRGVRLRCPLQVLWAAHDDLPELYGDPLEIWRPWAAAGISGSAVDAGHHLAEEAPADLVKALLTFWAGGLSEGNAT